MGAAAEVAEQVHVNATTAVSATVAAEAAPGRPAHHKAGGGFDNPWPTWKVSLHHSRPHSASFPPLRGRFPLSCSKANFQGVQRARRCLWCAALTRGWQLQRFRGFNATHVVLTPFCMSLHADMHAFLESRSRRSRIRESTPSHSSDHIVTGKELHGWFQVVEVEAADQCSPARLDARQSPPVLCGLRRRISSEPSRLCRLETSAR